MKLFRAPDCDQTGRDASVGYCFTQFAYFYTRTRYYFTTYSTGLSPGRVPHESSSVKIFWKAAIVEFFFSCQADDKHDCEHSEQHWTNPAEVVPHQRAVNW